MLEIFSRLEFSSVPVNNRPWPLLLLRFMLCSFEQQLPLLDHERELLHRLDSSFRRIKRRILSNIVQTDLDRVTEWIIEAVEIYSSLGVTEPIYGLLDGEISKNPLK